MSWENWSKAIHTLVGMGTIQERLISAYVHNLIHIKTEDLPEKVRERIDELSKDLTRVEPDAGEGSVEATVNKMSDEEACEYSYKILDMYCDLYEKTFPHHVEENSSNGL